MAQDENLEANAVLPGETEGPVRMSPLRVHRWEARQVWIMCGYPIAAFWDLWKIT